MLFRKIKVKRGGGLVKIIENNLERGYEI